MAIMRMNRAIFLEVGEEIMLVLITYDVNTQIYDQMANSQDISTDKADSQEMKQEWNGKE